MSAAADIWERILVKYPRDSLALHLVFTHYIHSGKSLELCDLTNRALPHYNPSEMGYGSVVPLVLFICEILSCNDAGLYWGLIV